MDRRHFLKGSSLAFAGSTFGLSAAKAAVGVQTSSASTSMDYHKYLGAKDIHKTTLSSMKNLQRDEILENALARIPTRERAEQIYKTVMTHIIAEEQNDVETTMSTMIENPVFEDVPAGTIIQGHKNIAVDYAARFKSFPSMKRHITSFMVDAKGVFVELVWEGYQKDSVKGIKPPLNARKFVLPVAAYFDVNDAGLIERESAYYDQYIGLLGLDILPDVMAHKSVLLVLNPGLILRQDKN